jgi:Ni/Fe-hydrogenase b-type cytochrome subunit
MAAPSTASPLAARRHYAKSHPRSCVCLGNPVRFYHWLNAFCLVVLCVTGYLIGSPLAIQQASEASYAYWFGKVRFLHFVFAYIFFFNFLFRIYWGFVGNRYAGWKNFIPFRKRQWKEIKQVIAVDILQGTTSRLKPSAIMPSPASLTS